MEQQISPKRARPLSQSETIFRIHGFFMKFWRSIVGVFRSSDELIAHERDLACPKEILYSVDDKATGDYEDEQALRQQLLYLGEEKATVVIMTVHEYLETVRWIDTRPISKLHQSIDLYWDIDNPCIHCGCIYLMGNNSRTRCCRNGALAMYNVNIGLEQRLQPLEPLEGTFLRLSRLTENSTEAHLES